MTDLQKLSKDLASIDLKVRQKALSTLQTQLPTLDRSSYKKICYGLFFFFWHSDGLDNQEKDSESICNLFGLLKKAGFVYFAKMMFEVLKKLWNRIDYHRANKFLGLVKDLLKAVYKRVKSENSKVLFDNWNKYLSSKLFKDPKG